MELTQQSPDIGAYLAVDEAIDHEHPRVVEAVNRLAHGADTAYAYARAAFEFVRDTIPHSADSGDMRVTWRASEVLAARTGICHAKSITLVALLRARSLPAGLAISVSPTTTGRTRWSTDWSRCGSPDPAAGRGWIPGATSRASTRSSPWRRSGWRGWRAKSSMKSTTR